LSVVASEETDLDAFGDLGDGLTREQTECRRRCRKSNLTASDVHHWQTRSTRPASDSELDSDDDDEQRHPVNNV